MEKLVAIAVARSHPRSLLMLAMHLRELNANYLSFCKITQTFRKNCLFINKLVSYYGI
jgi:hypothetical protein